MTVIVVHKKIRIEKILKGLIGGVIGIVLGFFAGGLLAYPIALLITPRGQVTSLAWLFVFALITSQLGMILGPFVVIRILERRNRTTQKWTIFPKGSNTSL